jgi:hypothetical protein
MNLEDVLIRDTRANQPLATAVAEGSLYYVTDEQVTEQSRGGSWVDYSDVGGGADTDATYITVNDETLLLPNSHQLVAGANIVLSTAVTNQISIATTGIPSQNLTFLTEDDETTALPNSRRLLAGTGITLDDTTPGELTIDAGGGITELTDDVLAGPGSGVQSATIAGGAVTTGKILNKNVTFNKLPDISNTNLLGRGSMGTDPGDVEEILLGTGLAISGTTLNVTTEIKAQVARVVLTDAQIKSGFTVPITIVAAPSAGQIIVPFEYTFIKETSSGAYVSPCNLLFRFAGSGIDLFTALNWFPTAANKRWGKVGTAQTGVVVGAAPPFATALQVLLSADNTGGNAANYLAFELLYIIMEDGP